MHYKIYITYSIVHAVLTVFLRLLSNSQMSSNISVSQSVYHNPKYVCYKKATHDRFYTRIDTNYSITKLAKGKFICSFRGFTGRLGYRCKLSHCKSNSIKLSSDTYKYHRLSYLFCYSSSTRTQVDIKS